MDHLERARAYMKWLERANKETNQDHYAILVIAYAVLAAVEWLYEQQDGDRVEAVYQEWKRDPSSARLYSEFREELVAEGLLGEEKGDV